MPSRWQQPPHPLRVSSANSSDPGNHGVRVGDNRCEQEGLGEGWTGQDKCLEWEGKRRWLGVTSASGPCGPLWDPRRDTAPTVQALQEEGLFSIIGTPQAETPQAARCILPSQVRPRGKRGYNTCTVPPK